MAEKEKSTIYVAVDCGKCDTKTVAINATTGKKTQTKFRTKISAGTFDDDMYGRGTFIVQVDDGPVYKVGRDAKTEPSLETSKKSDIHKVCTMAAIAYTCHTKGDNDVNVAIGLPLQMCNNAEERLDYRNFILGPVGEKHTIKIKPTCNGAVYTINFTIASERVYPEGIGILYEYPDRFSGPTGIIDIGNLNMNCIYSDQFLPINESCFTDELGGRIMIGGLAQELTSTLTRCDEHMVLSVLAGPEENRFLPDKKGNHKEVETKSKEIIDNFLLEHTNMIKSKCDARHWPIEFMDIVCMGGTSRLLKKELREVFGNQVFIPESPEFVNAKGFLRKICADNGVDVDAYTQEQKE